MSWPPILGVFVAASCLTLATIHFVIWMKHRSQPANLAFVALAVGVAGFAWAETAMMLASTPAAFAQALWWTNCTVFVLVVAVVAFIQLLFATGRRWLGHAAWATRGVALIVNFVHEPGFQYDEIQAMQPVSVFGASLYVPEGVTSGWHWVGQFSLALVFLFVVDATYKLWRLGSADDKRRALAVGVPTAAFVLLGSSSAALAFAQILNWPHFDFLPFVGVLVAMGYELTRDVLNTAQLSDALRHLSGRLITAQEDERRRLARDLHDDLSQQLGLLSIDLELVGRAQSGDARPQIEALARRAQELSSQVHQLSYRLHPAKLDQLGLEAAASSWCREVTQQSGVTIAFEAIDVPRELPADVALCLFRIIQEALRNVVRHSGAASGRVTLGVADSAIRVVISDSGRGFNVGIAGGAAGLGLLGMRERVQLLHGRIDIESHSGSGTRITATVPLAGRPSPWSSDDRTLLVDGEIIARSSQ